MGSTTDYAAYCDRYAAAERPAETVSAELLSPADAIQTESGGVTGAELCERADGLGLTVYLDWQGQELSAGLLIGEGTDEDS